MSAGKGCAPRKVDLDVYRRNYEQIFRRASDRPEEVPVCPAPSGRPEEQAEDLQESELPPRDAQADT